MASRVKSRIRHSRVRAPDMPSRRRIATVMHLLYQRIGGHQGISNLLQHFYADVRQDPVIGPIFNAEIKDWKKHLEIIASFWETLIGGPRTYARPMPMKHLPLHLREEHFQRWLFLWQGECRAPIPPGNARAKNALIHQISGHGAL